MRIVEFSPNFRRPAVILAALTLAACAPLKPPAPPPPPREIRVEVRVPVPVVEPADAAARQLIDYHARLARMTPAELAEEVTPRDDAALQPAAATQLALALSYSHVGGELARAQALLDQVARSTADEAKPWQGLARLVALRLAEQRRLEEQVDKLNNQARDNQRKLDLVNEKLEALKAIERSLNLRSSAPAGKTNAP